MGISDIPQSVVDRFWTKVLITDDCWLWQGGTAGWGYGQLSIDGKKVYAHRFSYEIHIGPIPPGLLIRHSCHVPRCVRPTHLRPGTNKDNTDDMVAAGRHGRWQARKTECKRGHAFTVENTGYDDRGDRFCRECYRQHQRNAYYKRTNQPERIIPF